MNFVVIFRYSIFACGFIPLAMLIEKSMTHHLGANPVEKITHFTGNWTLKFLLLSLSISPLQKILLNVFNRSWSEYTRIRRMLGLYAFFYGCMHFLIYLFLDRQLEFHTIIKDIGKRPYITVGFSALLLLVPLALTSTKKMQRKLGPNWKKLHRLIYLIAILAILHFYWLVKADRSWPIIYGMELLILFLLRILFRIK